MIPLNYSIESIEADLPSSPVNRDVAIEAPPPDAMSPGTKVAFTLHLWGEPHNLTGEVIEGTTNVVTTTLEQWEAMKNGKRRGMGDTRWEVAQTLWQPEGTVVVKYRAPGDTEDRVVQLPRRSVKLA